MKRANLGKRILSMLLALVLVIGMLPASALAVGLDRGEKKPGSQELSFQKVDDVDADLMHPLTEVKDKAEDEPEYADDDMVRVSIVLTQEPTLAKFSTVNVAANTAAMAYRDGLQKEQTSVVSRIEAQVLGGKRLDVVWNMTLAANIVSVNVPYGLIKEIEAVRGVKSVVVEHQYDHMEVGTTADPMMATSTVMTGANNAWAAGYTGAGKRIAVIDTGLDLDHQSFNDEAFLHALAQNAAEKGMEADAYVESLDLMTKADVAEVFQDLNVYPYVQYLAGTANGAYYINEKVPFAINYVDRDYDSTHDNDTMGGHGSHVAGIAAANRFIPSGDGFEHALSAVNVQGVAPDAQLVIMKVFGKAGGAYESDYMVAIEDAILLGCDVVNLSLGGDRGFVRSLLYQNILDSLTQKDVIVAIAAGNSGSWAEYSADGSGLLRVEDVDFSMVASPSTAVNALSVASADNIGATNYYIGLGEEVLFYSESQFSDLSTKLPPLTTVAGDASYIYIDGIGTPEDMAVVLEKEGTIAPNTVFVCARGVINFAEKANLAVDSGFMATIVYNNVEGVLVMNMDGYNHTNPAVSISLANGQKLKNAATPVTDGDGNVLYYKGTMYISDKTVSSVVSENYAMSDFSSWGVPGTLEIKPEITAPGGNIYSVDGENPSGTAYRNSSGTSMASPQIAGMAALVMQYIEETGLDVRLGISSRKLATSLLMSTAQPMMDGDRYYPVLQQGAGLANVGAAIASNSYVWMDEDATRAASDGKIKAELGDDPDRKGEYAFSFTLNNFSEQSQIYSISGDFFTQDTVTKNGVTYADLHTAAMGAGLAFEIEGGYVETSEAYECDLNGDSVTDEADARIILEYAAGNLTEIADEADVNENGTVSSYDAYLLMSSVGSGYFLVNAGDEVTVTVTVTLTDDAKAHLDSTFVNGAYVEGFVNIQPLVTDEGQAASAHSIPVLGFYGNWSDASMYDRLNYEEYYTALENHTEFQMPYSGGLNYLTFFDENQREHYFIGNPYLFEDTVPLDKIAIRPSMEVGDMVTTLIRGAGNFMAYVEDADGKIVKAAVMPHLPSAYYYHNAGTWNYVNYVGVEFWETPEMLGGFGEGDAFTVGFMSLPEYYETNGDMTAEEMTALKNSGTLGDGVYHSYTFTVDGTEPELLDVAKLDDGDLRVKVRDNRHVAAVAVLTATGKNELVVVGVDEDKVNTASELVIDMEGVRVNRDCMVMVADYAGNETFYLVEDYNEGLTDFVGRMYGFTNAKTRSSGNNWLEITVDELFYFGGDLSTGQPQDFGGALEMGKNEFTVLGADYVGGYVYMATADGELRIAKQGNWSETLPVAFNREFAKTRDMAFNTSDGKLYLLTNENNVYTVDLYTGALELQYKVSIVGPSGTDDLGLTKNFTNENKKLLTMAIDDEGNFYAVNNGDSTYQRLYLYTWTNDDAVDGEIKDLAPINDTYYGYAGDYVYSDDIPTTGAPTIQSMAWDHDNDILYWASALNAASPYNYLYKFDTETGKATIATAEPIEGVAEHALGCLVVNVSGLYIVPENSVELETDDTATALMIGREQVTLLEGAELRMTWDILPWNVENKNVTWVTSDDDVVTVSESGVVTAVGTGKATITATTQAKPYLFASCEITVEEIEDVALNGMAYNGDGNVEWMGFNLLDAENWTSHFVEQGYKFLAVGQHEDSLYAHDGETMYSIDINTFDVTDRGPVHSSWLWSDGTTGPKTPSGYFDRMVGIVNSGLSIGVMDVDTGYGYEVPRYGEFTEDPAALIAYIGPTTHHNGVTLCYGHEYYIMTESGKLYMDTLWAFYDTSLGELHYEDEMVYVGDTGLDLTGASNVFSGVSASMHYDLANDYLIVTACQEGASASVYVFQPEACAPVEVGSFGVGPVVGLYPHDQLTDVTVKVKPDEAECYVGETVQLTATVYMAELDRSVTWFSSDESIATVNAMGQVTALRDGTVTITATAREAKDDGTLATASAVITVKPLTELDVMLHAYIQTEDGAKWAAIDGNNLDIYTLAQTDAVYTGASVVDGKIYATDYTNYYRIDPTGNGYAVTKGDDFTDGEGSPCLYMIDGSGAPKVVRDMVDTVTGETVEDVTLGGTPVYLSGKDNNGDNYLIVLEDYASGKYGAVNLSATRYAAAIAYHRSYELEGNWFDSYYILSRDGYLEHYSIYHQVANGKLMPGGGWEVDYMPTGLVFPEGELSMVYVEDDGFKGVVVSVATEEGTELWCCDVETFETSKMGVLKGVTDLAGLSLVSGLNVELPDEPDMPNEPQQPAKVDYVYGYVQTNAGYAWAKINTFDLSYEIIAKDSSNFKFPAACALDGKIYTVTGVTQYGNTIYTLQQLDPTNGYAMNPTAGGVASSTGATPADMSGVPTTSVDMVDSATGKTVNATMGGYFLDAANGRFTSSTNSLYLVKDYTRFATVDGELSRLNGSFPVRFAGLVYVGSELSADSTAYYDYFLVLDQDGNLKQVTIASTVSSGVAQIASSYSCTDLMKLDLASKNGTSISRAGENVAYVSSKTTGGVDLYKLDLTTYELTFVGALNGILSLTGMHSNGELTGDFDADEPLIPDLPDEPECEHTNVGDWEYDEDGHWKTCECGEKVEQGAHEYVEGLCVCGKTDPNYQPEQPDEPDEPVVPADDTWYHGYLKTADGFAWAKINTETGAYEVLAEGDTEYYGGGVDGGTIYVCQEGDLRPMAVKIDPMNGYAATVGNGDRTYSTMKGLTAAPVKSVDLDGTACNVGLPVYVSVDGIYSYLYVMNDYASAGSSAKKYFDLYLPEGVVAASVAYASAEFKNGEYFEHYWILGTDGNLHEAVVNYWGEGGTGNCYGELTYDTVETGLSAISGASMVLHSENLLYISVNDASGVKLYSFDLTTNTLTELSTLAGAESLVALSKLSQVRPDVPTDAPEEPDQPDQPAAGNWVHGYVKTADGFAWAKVDLDTGAYEVLAEGDTEYYGGGVDGKTIYVCQEGATRPVAVMIDPMNGYAATVGNGDRTYSTMKGLTASPVKSVDLDGTACTVGLPVYVSVDGIYSYLYVMNDYASAGSSAKKYADLYLPEGVVAASVAYASAEFKNGEYFEYYWVLGTDGNLHEAVVNYWGEGGTANCYGELTYDTIETGLGQISGGSMTLYSENLLYISVNDASGVKFYSFDLSTNTLTELVTAAGLESLIALSKLSEVRPDLATDAPAEPEQPEQPEEPVNVTWYHGYIKTADGFAWTKINPATGAYEVLAEGTTEYYGGGVDGNIIYVCQEGATRPVAVMIDPQNGYAATVGNGDRTYSTMKGLTASSVKSVDLDGTACTVGLPVYVSVDGIYSYLYVMNDYTSAGSSAKKYADLYLPEGVVAASIAYASAEFKNGEYFEYYWVLGTDGNLHEAVVNYWGEGGTGNCYGELTYDTIETGLGAISGGSMTMHSENLLYISVNDASGVKLYSFDLTTNTLTELSTVTGAESLVALSKLSQISAATVTTAAPAIKTTTTVPKTTATAVAPAPKATVAPAAVIAGASMNTAASVVPDTEILAVVPVETESVEPAAPQTVIAAIEPMETVEDDNVVIENGVVTIDLMQTEPTTNGKLIVTFNPAVLTYQGTTGASAIYAVNAGEAVHGKLVIAYAAATAISAEEILATLHFTYAGETVNTLVAVDVAERNDNDLVEEDPIAIVVRDMSSCQHINTEVRDAVDATCTQDGYTGDTWCLDCGEKIADGTVIPAHGHSFDGNTCTACGAVTGWSGYTTWILTMDGVLTFYPTEQTFEGETNMKNYWKVGGVLTLPWSAYAEQITKVVISDGIHDLGQMAFYELPNLTTVELGKDVVEVRNYAFKNCTALTTVIGSETIDVIGEGAFYGCSALTELNLSNTVEIGDWAFSRAGFNPYN